MAAIRVVDIDPDLHLAFKLHCTAEGISMSRKLIELMRGTVGDDAEDHRQLAQAFSKGLKKVGKK